MKALLFLPLLALPTLAAETPYPPSLAQTAQARIDSSLAACEDARRALESGTGDQGSHLQAERRYLCVHLRHLPYMGMPESEAAETAARLRARLLANADAALELARQQFSSGLASQDEVFRAQCFRIRAQFFCKAKPEGELKAGLLALSAEAEAYWARQLEGAVVDKLQANQEIKALLLTQYDLFKLPVGERVLALCEENLGILEQRHKAGQANMDEVEAARDELQVQRHFFRRE